MGEFIVYAKFEPATSVNDVCKKILVWFHNFAWIVFPINELEEDLYNNIHILILDISTVRLKSLFETQII